MLWLIIPAVILVFLTFTLIRAAGFRPPAGQEFPACEAIVDSGKVIGHLAEMIRCKTVSYYREELIDYAEFRKFRELLERFYPLTHRSCNPEYIGKTGILFKFAGESSDCPSVLMAHYDVVPAEERAWEKPPFEGVIEGGFLWGRGTLDTKSTLCGVMESTEALLAQGFKPKNDIYLAFSGNEELFGESAEAIVSELEKRGVRPVMVVDEGGAVVQNIFPGVKERCALIGIGEKGMLDVEFVLAGKGGHSSAPPPHTPVGILSKAVAVVEDNPFKCQLTKPAREMFDTLGRYSTFPYRYIFANLWCFLPVLDLLCKKNGGEMNALMRTTCAFTVMEGSKAANVIPPVAKIGANIRPMGSDTVAGSIDYIKKLIKNEDISVNIIDGKDASNVSETQGVGWERLKMAIRQTWPDALISPYLMIAGSDSRYYDRISSHVYRFSAMELSGEERGLIHGNNERIAIDKAAMIVQFYMRLMWNC